MAFIIKDRVKEGTTTTGTGDIALNGAAATFDTFQSYMTNGDTTYYAIVHTTSGTDEWEVGLGTWNTGNTITRTTVLAGSNGTSAVNFSAGTKDVFMTYPAAHAALAGDDVNFANITVTGTVDGRDVAADGSKLDTVEQNADVTDTVNVAAAGALMKSGGTMTGNLILNADPTTALGAATKEYVDTIASAGIHYHDPVRVEAPSALTVTYNNGSSGVGATLTNAGTQAAISIDGVALSLNDRVLIYKQTDQTQNGVYTVTTVGSASTNWVLTRSTDTDSYGASDPDSFGKGDAFFVKEGNTGAGELYVMTTAGTITFGTTNIVFSQVAETAVYSAGTGLTLTGTTFSIGQDVGTTANVTFNQVTAAIIGNVTGNLTGDVTGNADTATALETARTIQLSGDVTGSATFDGSANINITAAVQDDSHAHVISNVDGLQAALDAKADDSTTITAGNGLTGGGSIGANRTLNVGAGGGITVSADAVAHADTSSQASVNNSGNTFIQDVTLDTYGHVTGLTSSTVTIGDATITVASGGGLTGSGDFTTNQGTNETITLSHADTSSQASVNNSGRTYIQDITLDTYGHITGITSATETVTNTNQLTTFQVEDGDGTEVTISHGKEWKFVEGGGVNIDWTDTTPGSDADPYDLTFTINTGITAGNGLTGGGTLNANRTLNVGAGTGISVSADAVAHADTSTLSGTYGSTSNGTKIDQITVDAMGHVTAITTGAVGDIQGVTAGSGLTGGGTSGTVTVSHADTSTQASVNNSGGTVIQDVTLDTYGHVTGLTSYNLDGRYYTETEADSRFVNVTGDTMTGSLNIGAAIGSRSNSISVDGDSNSSPIVVQCDTVDNAWGVLPWTSGETYIHGGVYYDDGTWVHRSSNTTNYLFRLNGGAGAGWYASNNSSGSWNVASNVSLWNSSGTWVGAVAKSPTLTLSGDASGSATFTNLGNATLSVTVANDSHSHSNYITSNANDTGTGSYSTSGTYWEVGNGTGSVAINTNDGYGNANLTFNHHQGVPDISGNAARIEVNVDSSSGANMNFEVKSGVTGGTAVQPTSILNLSESQVTAYKTLYENSNRVFTDGYHPNADKWTTSRTLSLSGDASGSVSWDGSANATLSVTVADDSHNHTIANVDGLQTALDGKLSTTGKAADSNLLDGIDSGSFIRSDASDNVTGHTEWQDNYQVRFGNGADFRIYHNGSHTYLRNYNHANGNIYIQGENTSGTNHGLIYGITAGIDRTYVQLFENNTERLRTVSDGVQVTGNITVSGTVDGRDIATDGTKLDGIETGATADQTASEILTAIKTVDGAGSGLNADFLDGYHESTFMRKQANSQLDMNNYDIVGVDQIVHEGDSNTYIQFDADRIRMYAGGVTLLDVVEGGVDYTEVAHNLRVTDGGSARLIDTPFWENRQTVAGNYTITEGYNAMSAGPITINSGVTVTIGSGETWTVV